MILPDFKMRGHDLLGPLVGELRRLELFRVQPDAAVLERFGAGQADCGQGGDPQGQQSAFHVRVSSQTLCVG